MKMRMKKNQADNVERKYIWFMPVTLNRLMSIIYQAFVFMIIDIDT